VATSDLKNRFGVPFWTPGQIVRTTTPADVIAFDQMQPKFPMRFFRAAGGDTAVAIRRTFASPDAQEPCTPTGTNISTSFDITVDPPVNRQLTVVYTLSGSAQNGVDYTNLSGSITLPAMTSLTNLWVSPKYDTNWELEETVYIDLVLTNGYLIDPAVP